MDRRWTWLLALAMLATLAALPSAVRAQGLRSNVVAVTLVATKPPAPGDEARFEDVEVRVPRVTAATGRVRLEGEDAPGGLWVRDVSGRLARVANEWIEVPQEPMLRFRIVRSPSDPPPRSLWRLRYAEGTGRDAPLMVASPVRLGGR